MKNILLSVWERRELVLMLIGRNLKIRYKGSVLGFFWSLLTPLCFIFIYAIFAKILKFNDGKPGYLQFLIVGIVSWQFFQMCMNDSLHSITGNVNLIKKTSFPRIILPLSTVLANLVNFILTLAVLVFYLFFAGVFPPNPIFIAPAMLNQTALCLGISLLASTCNAFFRDTEHIVSVLLLAWFFLTPVFYDIGLQIEHAPEGYQWLIYLNPMTGIICLSRYALLGTMLPPRSGLLISGLTAWIVLFWGIIVFQSTEKKFADEL